MIWIAVFVIVAGLAYIRLAPSDPSIWHRQLLPPTKHGETWPEGAFERHLEGGYLTAILLDEAPLDALKRIDRIAVSFVNTERFAGDLESGMITYISRSKYFGFPDYTTVHAQHPDARSLRSLVEPSEEHTPLDAEDKTRLVIYGRLRFGRSDLGVNRKRIEGWIKLLNPISEPGDTSSG